jgi:prolipoprotein diacylglyceryl transferase
VPTVLPILASIPSPSDNSIKIGPLELRAYGLAIALGVIAAVWIARRRWAARGGDPDDISRIALWAVLAGLIGARLYHVLTDLDRFEGRWLHVFAVWEGGLGIPGGLIAGVLTGAYVAHRRGLPVPELLDVVAPALPVAQAIGRLGNWFNQELFGRPTDLPWGLEIDPAHRPAGYLNVATFHPTFLYEALWNLALAGGLVLWERHHPGSRPGRLFALYVAGYAVGRAWVEALRIDPAAHLFGVRWNIWMSAIAFFAAVGWLVFDSWRARQEAERKPGVAVTTTVEATAGAADSADAGQPDATETAETAETAATAEAAATAESADTGEPGGGTAEPAEQPATDEAAEQPAPAESADTGEPGDGTAEPAEQPATDEAAEQPAPAESADTGEPGDGTAEPAEQPATDEAAADEPAAAGEPTTGETPTDADGQPDTDGAPDTSAATAKAGDEPASAAGTDREAGDAADDQPVAASPDADGGPADEPDDGGPTGREPGPARTETADEEAAT